MNYKTRSLRAGIAVGLLSLAVFLGADAFAQYRAGAEYRWELFTVIEVSAVALAVALFAWNSVQYAVKRNK